MADARGSTKLPELRPLLAQIMAGIKYIIQWCLSLDNKVVISVETVSFDHASFHFESSVTYTVPFEDPSCITASFDPAVTEIYSGR